MGKLEEVGEQATILKASGLAAIGNLRVGYCLLNIVKTSPKAILKAAGLALDWKSSSELLFS